MLLTLLVEPNPHVRGSSQTPRRSTSSSTWDRQGCQFFFVFRDKLTGVLEKFQRVLVVILVSVIFELDEIFNAILSAVPRSTSVNHAF
jgi:hypothetical protein